MTPSAILVAEVGLFFKILQKGPKKNIFEKRIMTLRDDLQLPRSSEEDEY